MQKREKKIYLRICSSHYPINVAIYGDGVRIFYITSKATVDVCLYATNILVAVRYKEQTQYRRVEADANDCFCWYFRPTTVNNRPETTQRFTLTEKTYGLPIDAQLKFEDIS